MPSPTKVALITGAGSGIGKATTLTLLKNGYHVVLAGRRQARLEQVVAEAGPVGAQALVVSADVSDPAAVHTLFARTKEIFGRLDVLFNNAGVGAHGIPLRRSELCAMEDRRLISTSLESSCAGKPSS
jgi:NAD(P)-dependent dehydrogenase (short-subunit alcohol dehydrogenase family)